ncbi:MAG: hypothetical protein U0175_24150 [Caldilineaceae bacterium]
MSSCLLVLLLLLSSCSSIRPIGKIGLIASFEGISRRNGYEALAAMRAAIADSPASTVDLLPLALDDSLDSQRTAQKLLADPTLKAVIGPLVPQEMALTLQDFSSSEVRWIVPLVVDPAGGFAQPGKASAWATELIHTVVAANQQAGRLYLVGWTGGWPQLSDQEWHTILGIDTQMIDGSALIRGIIDGKVQDKDLIFWLGSAEDGAGFVNHLWQVRPARVVWSSVQGSDPVFAERLQFHGPLNWTTWSNAGYETWSTTHTPATPMAYLTYLATRSAISQLQSLPDSPAEMSWTVTCFRLNRDGTSSVLIQCK